MIIRCLIVPLNAAVVTFHAGQGFAQGAFPAPLPGQAAPVTGSAFERGTAPPSQAGPSQDCENGFIPLRQDAEQRGKLFKAASERHAPPVEACKLIGNFGQAEIKMIKYVDAHAAECGIPASISEQLKSGHKNTETMEQKVCAVAVQAAEAQKKAAGPSLSDVLGSAATVPDAASSKKRGTTFDTLSGNALNR